MKQSSLMSLMRNNALGLYISIPFCRSKCTYCNFASGVYPASEHARYVERLMVELAAAGSQAAKMGVELPRTVDTIYLGGGTPSLLEPELISQLFKALHYEFDVTSGAEVTIECAPGQLAEATLAAMVEAGANRVSLGVQSFIDKEAHQSGRLHNRAMVLEDLRRLRAASIQNINLDLIAGLAGQTFASWDESVTTLLECAVPHASVYMLEVDEDSRLGREMLSGGIRYHAELVPTDDAMARMYETAIERLSAAGLAQYEISNFAREGFGSRHNLRYWERRPYLGLGLDASSMLLEAGSSETGGDGYVLRAKTTDDLKSFLQGDGETAETAWQAETAWLSPDRQHEEAWFLGLRLNEGVDVAALEREFGEARVGPARQVAARLSDDGLLDLDGTTVRLTARGRLLSNDVFQEFLGLTADQVEARRGR